MSPNEDIEAGSNQDGWDWPYILYVGRVWLHYTDEQIWKLTPRQFYTQLNVHNDVRKRMYGTGSSSSEHAGFIDQIPGW